MNPEPQIILETKIREIRQRLRLLAALQWGSRLAFYASGVGLLLLAATKLRWLDTRVEVTIGVILASALLGAAIGFFRRITPMETARITDQQLQLKERLSSALEFGGGDQEHPLIALQIEDAAAHCSQIDPRKAYPARCPQEAKFLGIAVAAILLFTLVPQLPMLQSPHEKAERAALQKQGEEIVRVAKEVQKHATGSTNKAEIAKRISRNMELLGKDMMRNRLTKKEAMLKMHQLTKEMVKAQQKLQATGGRKSADNALKDMKKASDQMPDSLKKSETGKLLQQMAQAAANKDFNKAKELAKKLSEMAKSGKVSQEDMKKAAQQLSKMASGLKGSQLGDTAAQLQKAAEAMSKGDAKEASKQLAEAMKSAQKADQKLAESDQLQKMAEAMESSQQQMQESSQEMAQQPGGG